MKQVYAVNPKTVVILVSSFPFAINWSQENVPAILHMAHSSQDEGTALAKVLFGDYNPGGHLVVTWPKSLDQEPPMMDYNIRDGRTYMYFKGEPLYPFGYGLSYTSFKYSNSLKKCSSPRGWLGIGDVTVSVDVTNTPGVSTAGGSGCPALYGAMLKSKVERPREELKRFSSGQTFSQDETKTVTIRSRNCWIACLLGREVGKFLQVEAVEPVRLMVGRFFGGYLSFGYDGESAVAS